MKGSLVRKWIYGLAAIIALALSGPMLPVELAIWFSGELLLYLEIVWGVWFMSGVRSIKEVYASARQRLVQLPNSCLDVWSRSHPTSLSWVQGALMYQ